MIAKKHLSLIIKHVRLCKGPVTGWLFHCSLHITHWILLFGKDHVLLFYVAFPQFICKMYSTLSFILTFQYKVCLFRGRVVHHGNSCIKYLSFYFFFLSFWRFWARFVQPAPASRLKPMAAKNVAKKIRKLTNFIKFGLNILQIHLSNGIYL